MKIGYVYAIAMCSVFSIGEIEATAARIPKADVDRARNLGKAAVSLYELGDYGKALDLWKEANKLKPDAAEFLWGIAQCHRKLAHIEEALASYETFLGQASDPELRRSAERFIRELEAKKQAIEATEGKDEAQAKAAQAEAQAREEAHLKEEAQAKADQASADALKAREETKAARAENARQKPVLVRPKVIRVEPNIAKPAVVKLYLKKDEEARSVLPWVTWSALAGAVATGAVAGSFWAVSYSRRNSAETDVSLYDAHPSHSGFENLLSAAAAVNSAQKEAIIFGAATGLLLGVAVVTRLLTPDAKPHRSSLALSTFGVEMEF